MHAPKERSRARNGTPDEETLWRVLVEEPANGVMIVSGTGLILYANEQAARTLLNRPAAEILGRSLDELFPAEWARERTDLMDSMTVGGAPILLRSIWRGRQLHTTIRRLNGHRRTDARYLHISRHPHAEHDSVPHGFRTVDSRVVELGALDALSTRELEVLALLGQGLRIKEIAALVHRTPKTIDNHRTSIGRKLRGADRVQLARLASLAGLELKDAALKRVRLRRDAGPPPRTPNGRSHRVNGLRPAGRA